MYSFSPLQLQGSVDSDIIIWSNFEDMVRQVKFGFESLMVLVFWLLIFCFLASSYSS
jgi:hypothetical protein